MARYLIPRVRPNMQASGMMLPHSALTAALSARPNANHKRRERDIEGCTGHRDMPLCSRRLAPCATRNALWLVALEADRSTTSTKPSSPLLPLYAFFFAAMCCRACPLARRKQEHCLPPIRRVQTNQSCSYMLPLAVSSCPWFYVLPIPSLVRLKGPLSKDNPARGPCYARREHIAHLLLDCLPLRTYSSSTII